MDDKWIDDAVEKCIAKIRGLVPKGPDSERDFYVQGVRALFRDNIREAYMDALQKQRKSERESIQDACWYVYDREGKRHRAPASIRNGYEEGTGGAPLWQCGEQGVGGSPGAAVFDWARHEGMEPLCVVDPRGRTVVMLGDDGFGVEVEPTPIRDRAPRTAPAPRVSGPTPVRTPHEDAAQDCARIALHALTDCPGIQEAYAALAPADVEKVLQGALANARFAVERFEAGRDDMEQTGHQVVGGTMRELCIMPSVREATRLPKFEGAPNDDYARSQWIEALSPHHRAVYDGMRDTKPYAHRMVIERLYMLEVDWKREARGRTYEPRPAWTPPKEGEQ